jgi:hypothetical protein
LGAVGKKRDKRILGCNLLSESHPNLRSHHPTIPIYQNPKSGNLGRRDSRQRYLVATSDFIYAFANPTKSSYSLVVFNIWWLLVFVVCRSVRKLDFALHTESVECLGVVEFQIAIATETRRGISF